jgi:hypothetical protein
MLITSYFKKLINENDFVELINNPFGKIEEI